jgi:hypothetical protein
MGFMRICTSIEQDTSHGKVESFVPCVTCGSVSQGKSENEAGQNNDYSACYSIGSLQGRKQRKLSQNSETIFEHQ